MRTLIMCAVHHESLAVKSALGPPRSVSKTSWGITHHYDQPPIKLVISGMGQSRACTAMQEAINAYAPERLLVIGYAGALVSSAEVGQAYICPVIHRGSDDQEFSSLQEMDQAFFRNVPLLPSAQLLTSEITLSNAQMKKEAHEVFGSDLVDLESAWWVELAQQDRIPWLVIRAVSDAHNTPIPQELNRMVNPDGTSSLIRAALISLFKPQIIPDLIQIGRNSKSANEALSPAIQKLFQ